MKQTRGITRSYIYALQPGDATIYHFGFFKPDNVVTTTFESMKMNEVIHGNHVEYVPEKPIERSWTSDLFTGIGEGSDYLYVWITESLSAGFYWIRRDALVKNPEIAVMNMIDQNPNGDRYTFSAIVLAISVLLIDHTNIQVAVRNMLNAPDLFNKVRRY